MSMAQVQGPSESFGRLISHIDNTGQMVHDNNAVASPFLNCKVLDVNMPRVRCGFSLVDHGDGRNVILVQWCRAILQNAKLKQHSTQILSEPGSVHSRNKLCFSRTGRDRGLQLRLVGDRTTSSRQKTRPVTERHMETSVA